MSSNGTKQDTTVRVDGVGKTYRIWSGAAARFNAPLCAGLANCLPRTTPLARRLRTFADGCYRDFDALSDVSFEVHRGECLGVIGRNGSGKSTLLQIVAGTTPPSSGTVATHGRITALLELGSGFSPEYTGRENVFLQGALLGIDERSMQDRFEEISDFAQIGDFIEQPVKTYSSGMAVRLAFAVQVLLDPDILVVDEALAVGDVFFRQKCFRRMRVLREQGVTVLFVSHDLNMVNRFCDRVLLLEQGRAIFLGDAAEGVKRYQMDAGANRGIPSTSLRAQVPEPPTLDRTEPVAWPTRQMVPVRRDGQVGDGAAYCTQHALLGSDGRPQTAFTQGETATFLFEFAVEKAIELPSGGVSIQDRTGQLIHVKHYQQEQLREPHRAGPGDLLRFRQDITLNLACGEYTYDVGLFGLPLKLVAAGCISDDDFAQLHHRICETQRLGVFAVVLRREYRGFQLPHWGLVDLPGAMRCTLMQSTSGTH